MPPLRDGLRLTFSRHSRLGRSCRRATLTSVALLALYQTHPSAQTRWEYSLKTVQLLCLFLGLCGAVRWGPHDATPPLFIFCFLLTTLKLEGVL